MIKIRSVGPQSGVDNPTLEKLLAHFKAYGLCQKPGYRGAKPRYQSYKTLSADALVEVGYDYLGEKAYVHLVEAVGYPEFAEAGRADWLNEHGDDEG